MTELIMRPDDYETLIVVSMLVSTCGGAILVGVLYSLETRCHERACVVVRIALAIVAVLGAQTVTETARCVYRDAFGEDPPVGENAIMIAHAIYGTFVYTQRTSKRIALHFALDVAIFVALFWRVRAAHGEDREVFAECQMITYETDGTYCDIMNACLREKGAETLRSSRCLEE